MESRLFLGKYRVPTTKSLQWWEARRSQFGVTCQGEVMGGGRKVVLELMPAFLLGETEQEELRRAAAAAKQIRHINIPTLYDFGVEREQFVFVAEYVDGLTAKSWVAAHGPMPLATALGIALQVVRALRVAAQYNLHHPAIHPGNLLIVPDQTADGGWPLVKVLHFLDPHRTVPAFDPSDPILGKAAPFASPEQIAGATVDFRSEIYSLGATLSFLLSATAPGASSDRTNKKRAVDSDQTSGKLGGVPKCVRRLLARMLSENRDKRPPDQTALEAEIRACLSEVDPGEMMKPVVSVSPDGALAEQASWRRFGMKLLATAGAAAILALALRGIPENAIAPKSAKVSGQRNQRVDSGAARNEAKEGNSGFPDAMNFAVASPSDQNDGRQVRSLEPAPGTAIAQGTSLSDEPVSPGEGPDVAVVEGRTKTERDLPTKALNLAPPLVIATNGEPAAPDRTPPREKN
jgi:serine/threonine protein kinase